MATNGSRNAAALSTSTPTPGCDFRIAAIATHRRDVAARLQRLEQLDGFAGSRTTTRADLARRTQLINFALAAQGLEPAELQARFQAEFPA